MKCEFIIVVGAEDYYGGGQRHNKMMFAQSAVRYTQKWTPRFDRTTVFCFNGQCATSEVSPEGGTFHKDGYTTAQINALKASVTKYKAEFKTATTWADVASHANNTGDKIAGCEKRVQVIVFFCHGTPGSIWLSRSKGVFLESGDLSALNSASFLPKSGLGGRKYNSVHATSWACQTANGADPSASVEANMSKSLAQKMANTWNVEVRASATRTIYSNVFTTGLEGRRKQWMGSRYFVDGVLWEDDGADGSVYSGESGDHKNLKQGMWILQPGQTSGYSEGRFD
jgi:hypothetical protein